MDAAGSNDREDGNALKYRWDWNGDGTYETAWSTHPKASIQYPTPGTKHIILQVRDSGGLTATATRSVSVVNRLVFPSTSKPYPGSYSGELGAHLYSNGTEFSIWARTASSVEVMTVNGTATQFTPLVKISGGNDDGVWWGFVPNARKGTEYKFVLNGATQVADPYSMYNRSSSGNSVVVDQNSFHWTDFSWHRPPASYYAVYELHVKDFTSHDPTVPAADRGKYAGVMDKLPYLKSLGITAIELMPISEFPDAGYSWGYNPSLYFAPESSYAKAPLHGQDGVDELKALINAAHNHGIAVILDVVFNHTAGNDNWLWMIDSQDYFSGSTPWGPRLNTSNPMVQRLGMDNISMWMKDYHVDGFRFDATANGWIDHNFLFALRKHAVAIDPNVFFVYENLPNGTDLRGFGAQWADSYHHYGVDLVCNRNGANLSGMASYIYYSKDQGWAAGPPEALNYLESHDEDTLGRLLAQAGFNDQQQKWRTRAAAVMLASSLGEPMIWMGQEFLRPRQGQDISEIPLDWSYLTKFQDVEHYYSGVFNLRKNNPALRPSTSSGFAWQYTSWTGDPNVLGYSMTDAKPADKKFVILLNFNFSPRTVNLGFPANGAWTKVIDETSVNGTSTIGVANNNASVSIQGSSGIVFEQ